MSTPHKQMMALAVAVGGLVVGGVALYGGRSKLRTLLVSSEPAYPAMPLDDDNMALLDQLGFIPVPEPSGD